MSDNSDGSTWCCLGCLMGGCGVLAALAIVALAVSAAVYCYSPTH